MEKGKRTLGQSIALLIALIFVSIATMGVVVYALVSKQNLEIGGNVTFTAEGVNATVEATDWEGCTINGYSVDDTQTDVLQKITYSTVLDDEDTSEVETWKELEVVVTSSPATMTFKVTNTGTSSIYVTVGTIEYKNKYDSNKITVSSSVTEEEAQEITASGYLEITITFTVADTAYDAELTSFTIPVEIANSGAETVSVENATYTLNSTDMTATLTSYTGSSSTVTIASSVEVEEASGMALVSALSTTEYTVTAIGKNAFSGTNCQSITTIIIPSSITAIGDTAFSGCTNLTKINNSSSVTISSGDFGLPSDGLTILSGGYTVTLVITYDGSGPVSMAAWAVATDTGEIQGGNDGSFEANAIYSDETYTFTYYNVSTIYLYGCPDDEAGGESAIIAPTVGIVSITITGATSGEESYSLCAGGGSSCEVLYTITLTQDVTIVAK